LSFFPPNVFEPNAFFCSPGPARCPAAAELGQRCAGEPAPPRCRSDALCGMAGRALNCATDDMEWFAGRRRRPPTPPRAKRASRDDAVKDTIFVQALTPARLAAPRPALLHSSHHAAVGAASLAQRRAPTPRNVPRARPPDSMACPRLPIVGRESHRQSAACAAGGQSRMQATLVLRSPSTPPLCRGTIEEQL